MNLLAGQKRVGMIVPLSLGAAKNMHSIRNLLTKNKFLCLSSFEIRPAKLFNGAKGADQRLNIFISSNSDTPKLITTEVQRWYSEHRHILFPSLHFVESFSTDRILRFSSHLETSIYKKYSQQASVAFFISPASKEYVHYRSAGLRYWIIFLRNGFNTLSASNKKIAIESSKKADFLMAALNSNLYWWYYSLNYDMFNQTESNILEFKCNYAENIEMSRLSKVLEKDLDNNKRVSIVTKNDGGVNESFAFDKKSSKPIIDEIDKVLAKHYGFTDEELDFIINYDIKYRMGDELNEED